MNVPLIPVRTEEVVHIASTPSSAAAYQDLMETHAKTVRIKILHKLI